MEIKLPPVKILRLRAGLLLLLLGLFSTCISAQSDSLLNVLGKAKGAEKISIQLDLAYHFLSKEKEKALEYADQALQGAQSQKNRALEMQAFYTLGRILQDQGQLEQSQKKYDSALKLAIDLSDEAMQGLILFRQGNNVYHLGKDMEAMQIFNEALNISRIAGDDKTMGSSASMVATIYRVNGLYDRAIEYTTKSKLYYEKAEYWEGGAWAAYLLGRIYADLKSPEMAMKHYHDADKMYRVLAAKDGNNNGVALCQEQLGLMNLAAGNFELARKHVDTVLILHQNSGSEYGISNAYKHLGKVAYALGNLEQADSLLDKALALKIEINDILSLPGIYEYKGLILIGKKKVLEGIGQIEKGLNLALKNNQKKVQLDIYAKLSEVYATVNNFEKANFYQSKQLGIQDSIIFGVTPAKMEQFQELYEAYEKNFLISELEKQKKISDLRNNALMIGIFFTVLISVVIYFYYRKIRRKNRQLNEVNATKDKLFSIVAHDLRGPIGATAGLSEYLMEGLASQDYTAVQKHGKVINQSLQETNNLLNNLLQWSQTQLDKIEFNPVQLDLREIVQEVGEFLASQSTAKNIKIKIVMPSKQEVFADAEMLKTILRNLISNAIKFSNDGGAIEISSKNKGDRVEVSVSDQGVGMDQDRLKGLFHLDSTTSTPGTHGEKGTGLGLFVVKDFVEKQGGEIWVKSDPGSGSTFGFTLLQEK